MSLKVIVVDDSASVRKVLSEVLSSDNGIEVIAASSDPIIARKHMDKEWPDVIVSDIDMPRKDGLTFLKEIMEERPTPVVICSSLTETNAKLSLDAMSAGAVSVISKPKLGVSEFLTDSAMMIIDVVKAAASANLQKLHVKDRATMKIEPKHNADVIIQPGINRDKGMTDRIVAIGASAGGTQAIEAVLSALPEKCPPIVIVQHMPEKFTFYFSERLNSNCKISVAEAKDGDYLENGKALIAPGNIHLAIVRHGAHYKVTLKDGPLVSRHRPSVDVLFRSVAKYAGKNAIGIILTGMGDDGAAGMAEMHRGGTYTVAQDEKSSAVYGMPKEAVKRGGVKEILPLEEIPRIIMEFAGAKIKTKN